MPGFRAHVMGGALVLLTAIVAAYHLYLPGTSTLLFASSSLLIGALLPDVDNRTSKPHRFFMALVAALAAAIAYSYRDALPDGFNAGIGAVAIAALAGLLAYGIIRKKMPRHRGIIHSLPAGLVYAALAGLAGTAFIAPSDAAFVGAFALAGYATHLAMDKVVK
jgi:membrane-bound metal-dependent hydrolase YbcI (DUF457 family)